jgi:hypothetical protein
MRNGWKTLGVLAGLALGQASALAQFPVPNGGYGMGGPAMGGPAMGGPVMGMPTAMPNGGAPGAFHPDPKHMGLPAEFPNPGIPGKEAVSPFSIKDEGMPNAFTELVDNRRACPPTCVFRTEYIGWWITPGPLRVPLVTTTTNLAGGEVGAQGQPGTVFLVDASKTAIDYSLLHGMRSSLGIAVHWFPPIEISGFVINRNYKLFGGGADDGSSLEYLARPITLADLPGGVGALGLNDVEFVNVPGVATGKIDVHSRLSLWNFETNLFLNFCDNGTLRYDFLFGYRHMDLYEDLSIDHSLTGLTRGVRFGGLTFPPGFQTLVYDSFRTRNSFDGGQIGIRSILDCDHVKFFLDTKLAIGVTHQYLAINGSSTLVGGDSSIPSNTLAGGILALPSNMGTRSLRDVTLIPEANLSISYQCTRQIRLYGGYNILYWPNVIRPGDHVTNVVDSRQIPTDQNFIPGFRASTPAFPTFVMRNLLIHGFHVGVEFGF